MAYDKLEVKKSLSLDNIFELLTEWGGDPEYTEFGLLSATICHNEPGEGSRKLYYYTNSSLFQCYTGCGSFDIFELAIKVFQIQNDIEMDLNDAVRYIAVKFGITSMSGPAEEAYKTEDWKILKTYDRIQEIELKDYHVELKEYNKDILSNMNYDIELTPWLNEDITQEVLDKAKIGYFPGGDQITIPHFDSKDRFIGLRGRTMCGEEAETFGKYRPIKCNQQLYNHPLGMNLYGYNWNKNTIKIMRKAIIFESEKSVLKYASYFGWDNNISTACCGSHISNYQIQLLLDLNVDEIIIAMDRQFKEIGDDEWKHLTDNLTKIFNRYKNYTTISFIFDKEMITGYKSSPIDEGKEKFLKLFKERVTL